MVNVKPLTEGQANLAASAAIIPTRYRAGIQRTGDWQAKASSESSENNYATKVQAAIAAKARQKAVAKVSNSDWQTPALTVGSGKIGAAVAAAAPKWAKNFSPYANALQAVTLPDRTADPIANIQRVSAVVQALVNAKKSQQGT